MRTNVTQTPSLNGGLVVTAHVVVTPSESAITLPRHYSAGLDSRAPLTHGGTRMSELVGEALKETPASCYIASFPTGSQNIGLTFTFGFHHSYAETAADIVREVLRTVFGVDDLHEVTR